jgi:hypothetical protein
MISSRSPNTPDALPKQPDNPDPEPTPRPIIPVNDHHKGDCLQVFRASRNIATSLTGSPLTTGSTTMTIHLINAAALTVVTVFLVNRAFAFYDLIKAATVSEHI